MNIRKKRRSRTAKVTKKPARKTGCQPYPPNEPAPAWGTFTVPHTVGSMANCCSFFQPSPPTREEELKNTIKRLVDLI